MGARRARGEQALGVSGAVAAFARISIALLHERPALAVGQHRSERMIAGGARPPREEAWRSPPRHKGATVGGFSDLRAPWADANA